MTSAEAETQPISSGERRFVWLLACIATLLALFPAIYAWLTAPAGERYLGYQFNTDDHMVYAAWMRQAMDGHFFMDNRFTTDAQPGLTVHLYFFLLGLVAKVTGIALATTLARAGFSILFVWLLYGLLARFAWQPWLRKLALVFVVFGGGLGFLVWHKFGQVDLIHPPASALIDWATPGLPVDVWQPEGFVFSSMLTNSLFVVSLCLIIFVFSRFLDARKSWRAVIPGALALGVLMNIHSYDTLLIGLVMLGFVIVTAFGRQLSVAWTLRAGVIAAGMILPALWFVHVLRSDPVFQSRAATLTYSPSFRQVTFGYFPLMILGFVGMFSRTLHPANDQGRERAQPAYGPRPVGVILAAVVLLVLFAAGTGNSDGAFLNPVTFGLACVVLVFCILLMGDAEPLWNLVVTWALIGTVAIYFPSLFQRKLAMGLSIPWAILAAYGLGTLLRGPHLLPPEAGELSEENSSDRKASSLRPLAGFLAGVFVCATSLLWVAREISFVRSNISSTTRHTVYLNPDEQRIIDYLNQVPGRKVVLAVPGSNRAVMGQNDATIPDEFESPPLPDLAPILSGLTGAYTYAGHWSETPDYDHRAGELNRYFLDVPIRSTQRVMSEDDRRAFEHAIGANFVVVPMRETYSGVPWVTPEEIGGTVVVSGKQFSLVKLG
jgi:arabinosyltransferase C